MHLHGSELQLFWIGRGLFERMEQECLQGQFQNKQEFVMRIAFNLAAAFVSSAVIILSVI